MQRLRAEHEVDVRGARDDGRTLLRRDAAADADQDVRAGRLQAAYAAEVVEHALLRLFAHRAGVEQDDVRVLGTVGQRKPFAGEHVGHAVRVVLVHLAAERANEKLACHWDVLKAGDYSKTKVESKCRCPPDGRCHATGG